MPLNKYVTPVEAKISLRQDDGSDVNPAEVISGEAIKVVEQTHNADGSLDVRVTGRDETLIKVHEGAMSSGTTYYSDAFNMGQYAQGAVLLQLVKTDQEQPVITVTQQVTSDGGTTWFDAVDAAGAADPIIAITTPLGGTTQSIWVDAGSMRGSDRRLKMVISGGVNFGATTKLYVWGATHG